VCCVMRRAGGGASRCDEGRAAAVVPLPRSRFAHDTCLFFHLTPEERPMCIFLWSFLVTSVLRVCACVVLEEEEEREQRNVAV